MAKGTKDERQLPTRKGSRNTIQVASSKRLDAPAAIESTVRGAVATSLGLDDACAAGSLIALARLASNVVHAINNPLGTALSSGETALRLLPSQFSPPLSTCIERTVANVRRASEAVRILVRFCCHQHSARQVFDLRDVIRFATIITETTGSSCRFTIDTQFSEPALVRTSPIAIQIALASLISERIDLGAHLVRFELTAVEDTIKLCVSTDSQETSSLDRPQHQQTPYAPALGLLSIDDQEDWISTLVREYGGELYRVSLPDNTVSANITLPRCNQECQ